MKVKFVMKLLLLLNYYFIKFVIARCPNKCSGHGTCSSQNICNCFEGWTGGAADCSTRICPAGLAWADKAYSSDLAHQLTECSNAGICDRSSGSCKCFNGYTGSACQRTTCPNDCSGNGICSSIGDVSYYLGPSYDNKNILYGYGEGPIYDNWDKNAIQMCECSRGYFGADCSIKACPKGDDPLTVNQNYRKIQLYLESYGASYLSGKLILILYGEKVVLSLDNTNSQICTNELAHHGPFGYLNCEFTQISIAIYSFTLTFYSWPISPRDNNLFTNNGDPSIYDFYCDITDVLGSSTCTFTNIIDTNIIEYAYCSNRGLCNFKTGDCTCYDGFGGAACSNVTYIYEDGSNTLPGLQVNVNTVDYTSSILQVSTLKSKASDFNFIQATAANEVVFFVRGDGYMEINKLTSLAGHTVSNGGLFITRGGATIASDGLTVDSTDNVAPVALFTSSYTGALTSKYDVLRINSETSTPSQLRAIEVRHEGHRVFAVRGDGSVLIYQMGMYVTGGITLNSGGLSITGGATINNGGLRIASSGLIVTGGATINSGGLNVLLNGAQIYSGGASIYSGGLRISGGGQTIMGGGLTVTGGITINSQGLRVTGGMTVNSGGAVITSGMTIYTGGISATGGLTIMNGGFKVTGGMTVLGGGLFISNGLTIQNSGIFLNSGNIIVNNGGIKVTGGMTLNTGGLIVTGGITANSGGMKVSGGLSVLDTGVFVTGGLTLDGIFPGNSVGVYVKWGGLIVQSGGVSVNGNTGLSVASGVTVSSGGLQVSGPSKFANDVTITGGLLVQGGLTVQGSRVYFENTPVVYSDRNLKTNLIPITEALDKVSKLKGVYFDWIKDEVVGIQFDNKRHVGVIAQNVLDVLPEAVDRKDGSNYLGVDYTAMVPLLIEAMHELEDQISKLNEEDRNSNVVNNNTLNNDNKLEVLWSEMQKMHLELNLLKAKNELLEKEIKDRKDELVKLSKLK